MKKLRYGYFESFFLLQLWYEENKKIEIISISDVVEDGKKYIKIYFYEWC